MTSYTSSRFQPKRFKTRVVNVGSVGVGGENPIRIQSMTNTLTQDVEATVKQAIALAEVGCEIVRVTAPNVEAAKALKEIRKQFSAAGFSDIPLVADIHFLPKAAMEAIEHVEKVRVNPGNYADKKKFAVLEYTDAEYNEELERLHDAFSPLVLRAKELGRSLRIGTNHGSLSDRIMNRYGDTPLGMVEAALEFVRISESHNFQNIILSLKASNPKVMIQAYRLAVEKMQAENMNYPLHLGVTEAGDGEDGRIKSAIGIGSLLADGIGDSIRVSLTEDPVYEIPVAKDLAAIAHKLWENDYPNSENKHDSIDPFEYKRREIRPLSLTDTITVSSDSPPAVFIKPHQDLSEYEAIANEAIQANRSLKDSKIEGLILSISNEEDLSSVAQLQEKLEKEIPVLILDLAEGMKVESLQDFPWTPETKWILSKKFLAKDIGDLESYLEFTKANNLLLSIDTLPENLEVLSPALSDAKNVIFTTNKPEGTMPPIGTYRALAEAVKNLNLPSAPIWIRNTKANAIDLQNHFTSRLLEASVMSGSLFCDGLGDMISIETEPDFARATTLAYNILQGTRLRMTKTEFVACPSCGRTLFNLEETTKAVRAKTGHLKGVTIAIMGCIVNGPGEMADADFGYVGGAPGKINLYVGKKCVKYNIPQAEAVDRLIELIKEHGKWVEPEEVLAAN